MPKKGKKGGAGKLPPLTPEEMAKKKEEMLSQFLKDKLQREEKNIVVNQQKLTQQWRVIFRQARATELRNEMTVLSQTFDRVLDRKDSVIKCLLNDLRESEQQSALALSAHLHCVDSLLALQRGRLAFLYQQWNDGLQELSTEFNTEREYILSLYEQDCSYLDDLTAAMEQRYRDLNSEAQQNYQSVRDDIKNRNIEEKQALQVQRESTIEDLWSQVQMVKQGLNPAARINFESLRSSDQRCAQRIEAQIKRLHKLQVYISGLRLKLTSSQKQSETAVQELRTTKEEVTLKTRQLKLQMSRARAAERGKLTNLTIQSNAAAKKLLAVICKGEKVLRLAEMARKLETEHIQVLPFYTSSLSAEEQTAERLNTMETPSEELAKEMLNYLELDRFWQRYNKVLLERLCLEKEKEVLMRENQQLQALLRQYLDGISVNDEILRRQNHLLVVSQPTIGARSTADRMYKKHTVIEAAHVVQHTL